MKMNKAKMLQRLMQLSNHNGQTIADEFNVTPKSVSRWKNGEVPVPDKVLEKLAKQANMQVVHRIEPIPSPAAKAAATQIGQLIAALRFNEGVSSAEAAARSGVLPEVWERMEAGIDSPTLEFILRALDLFGHRLFLANFEKDQPRNPQILEVLGITPGPTEQRSEN